MSSNNEIIEALKDLAAEKNISMEVLFAAIEESLKIAVKNNFKNGTSENARATVDRETGDFHVYLDKTVCEEVTNPNVEISLEDAQFIDGKALLGDVVSVEIKSKEFCRIAAQSAKNTILQKIREEERKVLYDDYYKMEKKVVTGVITRISKPADGEGAGTIHVNLGKLEGVLTDKEQVEGESFKLQDRIKVYIVEVKNGNKGPRILLSRTHPELVRKLFEEEVSEIRDGIVEIKSIAREAGSRTKMAVFSHDSDVDPVGACVGQNGSRVNAVVDALKGEKIDIIEWNENPAMLVENSLSPSRVIAVIADADEKMAKVVVPDAQLSLAIGNKGQNARLAARLTGFKIDIKSETQAQEAGDFLNYDEEEEEIEENEE